MNIKQLLIDGTELLKKAKFEDSRIIANILIQKLLKMDRMQIIINEMQQVNSNKQKEYFNMINKVINGVPLQYITNYQEFMGYKFFVDENVLIPQPDTEILVEEVLKISQNNKLLNVLDICTGSGCIGISLAKRLPNAQVTLADISNEALQIAKKNAKINKADNTNFIKSNMFDNINISKKYDIIVSNPPYIETKVIKTLEKSVQNEPHLALDGGKDGLDFYRILIKEGMKYITEDGFLCMEIGYDQKEKVLNLIKQKEVYCKKDLSLNDRVIIVKK